MMKAALLVIDFIQGIAAGKGTCAAYLQEHPEVIANTNRLIDAVKGLGWPVFHIRLAFDPTYRGLPKYAPPAKAMRDNKRFQLGDEATQFIPAIKMAPEDVVVNKTYGDVFQGNDLIMQLRQQDIEHVMFTGVATDNAILNGANSAMRNDFYVTVVEDACGSPTREAHENALNMMKGRTASAIVSTDEALANLSKPEI